jgi:hypothetical protein
MTTTRPYPAARSTFAIERTPPSMYRVPFTVIGGHTSGTAQLAATASSSEAPLRRSKIATSPLSAATATMRSSVSGQVSSCTRVAMAARRSDSSTVGAASAARPSQARLRRRSPGYAAASRNRSSAPFPIAALRSPVVSASSCAKSLSSGSPLVTSAATTEPAEVPTKRSAPVRSRPRSASPCRSPISHATPVTPPAPRTTARPLPGRSVTMPASVRLNGFDPLCPFGMGP